MGAANSGSVGRGKPFDRDTQKRNKATVSCRPDRGSLHAYARPTGDREVR